MHDGREDLKLAKRLGFFLLHVNGLVGGVEVEGRILRFDPGLNPSRRAQLVCQAIRFEVVAAVLRSDAA